MKKILSLSAAAAVLSLTAVAASADIVVTDNGTAPVAGEEYVVEVVVDGEFPLTNDLAATQFTVVASDNLSLVSSTPNGAGLFNEERMTFAYAAATAPADGTVLLTLVFSVDAAAEEEVSVTIVPDAGFEAGVDVEGVTTIVVDGSGEDITDENAPDDTDEPIVEVTDEPIVEVTDEPTGDEDEDNAHTGIALAVVPAIVAGAVAVVAAKKRK